MMNLLAIFIPTLTVLIGILLNRDATNRLEASVRADISTLRTDMAGLRSDMTALRAQTHSDLILLLERDNKLESRVAQIERVA